MFYNIYDKQTGCYLVSGHNSTSKTDCLEAFRSYLIGGEPLEDDYLSFILTADYDTLERELQALEFSIDESDEPFYF